MAASQDSLSEDVKSNQSKATNKISLSSKLSGLVRVKNHFTFRKAQSTASADDSSSGGGFAVGAKIETISLVTVRAEESIESGVVMDLAMGTPLEVLHLGEGRRMKVKATSGPDCVGWISSKTRMNEPLVEAIRQDHDVMGDFEVGGIHEVLSNVLLRQEELLSSDIVRELQPGAIVRIIEIGVANPRRAKIASDDTVGWMSTSTKAGELLIGKCQEASAKALPPSGNKVKDMLEAARSGDLEKLQIVCAQGNNMFSRFTSKLNINASDIRGKTALIYAAAFGHKAVVEFFLARRDIDVNLLDDTLKGTLHHACKGARELRSSANGDENQSAIVMLLIKAGGVVEARDHNGCTPLMFAAANGFQQVVVVLLKVDVNVNVKDYEGNNALAYARNFQHNTIVKLLKDKGSEDANEDEDETEADAAGDADETASATPGDPEPAAAPDAAADAGDAGDAPAAGTLAVPTEKKKAAPKKGAAKKKAAAKKGAEGEAKPKKKAAAKKGAAKAKGGPRKSIMLSMDDAQDDAPVDVMEQPKEEEDEKTAAMRKLATVMAKVEDAKVLQSALDECVAVGVEGKEITEARAKVEELKQKNHALAGLRDAIESKDVEQLQTAIAEAKKSNISKKEIDAAEKTLKEEKPKAEARVALQKAQEEGPDALKKAIAAAKKAGLDADELEEYEGMVKSAESKDLAETELKKAVASLDISALKGAIQICKSAKVDAALIEHAEKVLAEEEPKVEARAKLEAAMASGVDADLEAAVALAKKIALPEQEYSAAAEALERNKKKRVLLVKVQETMQKTKDSTDMKDIDSVRASKEELAAAIKEALDTGVSESDVLSAELWRKKLHNTVEDLKGAIRVFCRIRPLNSREKGLNDNTVTSQPNPMTLEVKEDKGHVHPFTFDAVFTPGTQEAIFEDCKDLVQSAVDGYNVTLFAYGQTGAGKTFTMAGVPGNLGVSPRTIEEIFKVTKEGEDRYQYTITGSMLELYCQDLVDLLAKGNPAAAKQKLKIREQKDGTIMVEHLSAEQCNCAGDLHNLLDRGMKNRAVSATAMNSESSRSHLLLVINIISINHETKEQLRGKMLIVDLAGSERLGKSQTTGQAQKESIEINQSLTCLGNVIESLTKPKKGAKPPYRDSNLTMVMKDALGGTAKTLMFVNCSPAGSNIDETLNSLKYAQRAKKVENKQEKKK